MNKSKSGGVNSEIVAVSRSQDVSTHSPERPKGPDSARVAQLEQNIRFLQEQHQLMLTGLHNEIESLRNKNRGLKRKQFLFYIITIFTSFPELQFQLVFVKGTLPSSPSSPEDDTKHKVNNIIFLLEHENVTKVEIRLLLSESSNRY